MGALGLCHMVAVLGGLMCWVLTCYMQSVFSLAGLRSYLWTFWSEFCIFLTAEESKEVAI